MSDRSRAPLPPARQTAVRRLRCEALCIEAAVAMALVLSICTILYVLSVEAAKTALSL